MLYMSWTLQQHTLCGLSIRKRTAWGHLTRYSRQWRRTTTVRHEHTEAHIAVVGCAENSYAVAFVFNLIALILDLHVNPSIVDGISWLPATIRPFSVLSHAQGLMTCCRMPCDYAFESTVQCLKPWSPLSPSNSHGSVVRAARNSHHTLCSTISCAPRDFVQ